VSEEARAQPPTVFVTTEGELRKATLRLSNAPRLGVDIESNGLFKYKASLCTMQIASDDEIVVIDTIALAANLEPLRSLLGTDGPRKIIHDIAFDARLLAESGLPLGNVFDTSIAARMLGRVATGLASLLDGELGIKVDKRLQHHDWTERPIRADQLKYLADDVLHLHALADKLIKELETLNIADAVEEETNYRLAQAIASVDIVDPRPPYLRMKGIDRVPADQLPILRRLAELRETKAKSLDVPPYKVVGPDVLYAIAQAKPQTLDDLGKIKGATGGHRARSLGPLMIDAVIGGQNDGVIPENEKALMWKPRLPPGIAKARRAREGRLTGWRKTMAKTRAVDEQVILPGHCLQDLADIDSEGLTEADVLAAVSKVPGLGQFRIERDAAAIANLLMRGPTKDDQPKTTDAGDAG